MILFFVGRISWLGVFFRSRHHQGPEILTLRQQRGVLKRTNPRPRLRFHDRMFWVLLRRLWPSRISALVFVKPETIVAWHRAGFRLFWRLRSRPKCLGRPQVDADVRALIRRIVSENPSWGAPRIHDELLKLGFDVSERTISRYLRRRSPSDDARKHWTAFLRNHRDVIAAMDFSTVPTTTRWTPGDIRGHLEADPGDELSECLVGSADGERGTAQARDRGVPGHGREVHDEVSQAAVADVAVLLH